MIEHDSILSLLNGALEAHLFSGYQLVFFDTQNMTSLYGGRTGYGSRSVLIDEETFFDLGSLTKVIFTTSFFARAVEKGSVDLQDHPSRWLTLLKGTEFDKIEVRHILSHSAGFKWWHPIYRDKPPHIVRYFLDNSRNFLLDSPGNVVRYSDLGIILLGEVMKTFADLKTLFETEVSHPLHLKKTRFGPVSDCAAHTEYCNWRKKQLMGEVFDENTHFFHGVSSHAGLFSNALDLSHFCREWLLALQGKSVWLSSKTAKLFTERSKVLPQSTWALGFDTKSKVHSSAGEYFSPQSFGHLGFTGCSMWIDPVRQSSAIFLTNRVHPSRFDERIKRFRPILHNAIVKLWESHGS